MQHRTIAGAFQSPKPQKSANKRGRAKTTSRLTWDEFVRIAGEIKKEGDHLFYAIFVLGVFFALRQGDLMKITWRDVATDQGIIRDSFIVSEQKTKKQREITISSQGKEILKDLMNQTNSARLKKYVFSKHLHKMMCDKYVNYNLKKYFKKFGAQYSGNISSHLFRKTFGRHYWEQNNCSEAALVKLQLLFGHSDIRKTMRYLGIEREEIAAMYESVGSIN